jgi:hypothetical protein
VKYLLMICGDEETDRKFEEAAAAGHPGCDGWSEEMVERGVVRGGAGLRPAADATTIRVRGDEVLLSDGPFAETKEQIGGFTLIECADLDEAIEIAAKHPGARFGSVEVRPVWEP